MHLGPLPTYKGSFVQHHIGRNAVQGGASSDIFPLVVMIGPSGVGELIIELNLLYVLLHVVVISSLLLTFRFLCLIIT